MPIVRTNATAITLDPSELDLGLIATRGVTRGGVLLSAPTVRSASPFGLEPEYSVNGGGAGGKYGGTSKGSDLPTRPCRSLAAEQGDRRWAGPLQKLEVLMARSVADRRSHNAA